MSGRFEEYMATSILSHLEFADRDEGEHAHDGVQRFVLNGGDEPGPSYVPPPQGP